MILITGGNGFVGKHLLETVKGAAPAPSLRNATQEDIRRIIGESGAETIIHTAAISDIGVCQSDPEASFLANVQIPLWIAQASAGRKLICFSSDQVYSGSNEDGPYTEEMVAPGNVYAAHKLEMEQRVLDALPDAVMLRAEWMYDIRSPKPNYLLNILQATDMVAFSSSQYRGVTYLREVAENMDKVIRLPGGAYNFGSETTQSMHEITKQLAKLLGKKLVVEDAPPRHNLWMNCGKAKGYGVSFSDVLTGLTRCLTDYGIDNLDTEFTSLEEKI